MNNCGCAEGSVILQCHHSKYKRIKEELNQWINMRNMILQLRDAEVTFCSKDQALASQVYYCGLIL